jgi:hypothetical protein
MTRCSGDECAFPFVLPEDTSFPDYQEGMTKREYFAAKALQGLLAAAGGLDLTKWEYPKDAVLFADALIAELNRKAGE